MASGYDSRGAANAQPNTWRGRAIGGFVVDQRQDRGLAGVPPCVPPRLRDSAALGGI
jgi:hypothetical protein